MIETTVVLRCDDQRNHPMCEGEISGETLSAVKAEARADGWLLTKDLHLCSFCSDPKAQAAYEEQEQEQQEWWSEHLRQQRESDRALPCPTCGADPGLPCRSTNKDGVVALAPSYIHVARTRPKRRKFKVVAP